MTSYWSGLGPSHTPPVFTRVSPENVTNRTRSDLSFYDDKNHHSLVDVRCFTLSKIYIDYSVCAFTVGKVVSTYGSIKFYEVVSVIQNYWCTKGNKTLELCT